MSWHDALKEEAPWAPEYVVGVLQEHHVERITLKEAQWLTMCSLGPIPPALKAAGIAVDPSDTVVC